MNKYDIVVVGAGNAGLIAALRAAYSGKKTLLIEQHNLPGGCATSFRRGRFEFEPSLHEFCDLGPEDHPGDIRKLFNKLGIKVEWCRIPDCFRLVGTYSDGAPMDVTMPNGVPEFIAAMEKYVPGTAKCMQDFFDLGHDTLRCTGYIAKTGGRPDPQVMMAEYGDVMKTGAYPTNKVLRELGLPPRAMDIMAAYWSYLGVDLDHIAFIQYAAMVHKYITHFAYFPKYTSHGLSTAVLERYRELGGEVWLSCRAERFLFEGDRCCGVATTQGEVYGSAVLANINPNIIYGKMMPPELVPEREKKLCGARTLSGRMLVTYFGLNKSAEELGIKDYCVFMPQYADSVKEYAALGSIEKNKYCCAVCYNIAEPDISPEGTCILSILTMYTGSEWGEVKPQDYVAAKEKVARQMMETFKERTGVDISGAIEEVSIASPWTFARYIGVPEGAVYGYETADWDAMMARMMMVAKDYPIKGLYPIGAAGPRGDGYSTTYVCGDMIAKMALRGLEAEGGKA